MKPVRSPLIQRPPAGSSFRLLAQTFYSFIPRYFQTGAMISNNGGDIFPIFYESRLFRFFTIAEYFTSETIMALSNGNITTFSFKNK